MHARGDIGGDNISLQKMALKRVLKRGFFLLRRKVRRFMETGNTSVKRLFFRPFSRKLVSCWSNSEATLLNVSSANLGRERKERMKKSSDTSQTADKVQWNKHVLLRRLFSRKVVSSYKKEANEEATSTQHWTWWLNASSNGKVRVRTITYLVCLRGREFTYSTVVQYSSSLSDAITVTNELLSTRGVLSKQLLKRIQSSGSI